MVAFRTNGRLMLLDLDCKVDVLFRGAQGAKSGAAAHIHAGNYNDFAYGTICYISAIRRIAL